MSSLPNPLRKPKPTRPTVQDHTARVQQLRKRTNYEKGTGYAPYYHGMRPDIYRLSSGKACLAILLEALAESHGTWDGRGDRPEWSEPMAVSSLARMIGTDERTVERELVDIHKRKVADVKRLDKGVVSIRLLYRAWEKLPDYKPNVVDISTGEEFEEEEGEQETKQGSRVELTKRPQPARAGKASRKIPVKCGVKSIQLQNNSVVDLSFTAVVQGGDLILSSQVPDQWLKKALKQVTVQTNGTNHIEKPSPTCTSGSFASSSPNDPANGKATDKRSKSEHPRAKELSNLFDPLLLKSQAKLLSTDPIALSEACQAAGATDHNWLVKFILGRGERGPIKSPKHCKHILEEAARNWEKVKDLPAGQQERKPAGKESLFTPESKARIAEMLKQKPGAKI